MYTIRDTLNTNTIIRTIRTPLLFKKEKWFENDNCWVFCTIMTSFKIYSIMTMIRVFIVFYFYFSLLGIAYVHITYDLCEQRTRPMTPIRYYVDCKCMFIVQFTMSVELLLVNLTIKRRRICCKLGLNIDTIIFYYEFSNDWKRTIFFSS